MLAQDSRFEKLCPHFFDLGEGSSENSPVSEAPLIFWCVRAWGRGGEVQSCDREAESVRVWGRGGGEVQSCNRGAESVRVWRRGGEVQYSL